MKTNWKKVACTPALQKAEELAKVVMEYLEDGHSYDRLLFDLGNAMGSSNSAKQLLKGAYDHILDNLRESREQALIQLIPAYRDILKKASAIYDESNPREQASALKVQLEAMAKLSDLLRLKDLIKGEEKDEQKPFQIEIVKPKAE